MPGQHRYLLHVWDPTSGGTMQDWAQDLADIGWAVWCGPGGWTTIDGGSVWRLSLPRKAELFKAEVWERRHAAPTAAPFAG